MPPYSVISHSDIVSQSDLKQTRNALIILPLKKLVKLSAPKKRSSRAGRVCYMQTPYRSSSYAAAAAAAVTATAFLNIIF